MCFDCGIQNPPYICVTKHKKMKTYIVTTKDRKTVATLASNKREAWAKVNAVYPSNKGMVSVSSCHIDYVSCIKL